MLDHALQFPVSLQVTDQQIDLSAASDQQKSFYLTLFSEVVELYRARAKPRFVLGIAGPTGAGKSVVAVLLKELARQAKLPFAVEAITMDAYHFPNAWLLSHFSDGEPLKRVKGRFDTYDPTALAMDLGDFSAGSTVAFPAYSRKLHDPVPNALVVSEPDVLLIVEGLWLLYDQAGWDEVGRHLDYSIFIDADPDAAKEPVLQRHIRGGRTLEDAQRHYEKVDAKNSALVLTTRSRANRVIPAYYAMR